MWGLGVTSSQFPKGTSSPGCSTPCAQHGTDALVGVPDGEGKIPAKGPSFRCEWTPLPNPSLVPAVLVASTGMRNEYFSFPTSTLVSGCVLLII